MPELRNLFARESRTLVGMIHLPPMPGSPRHDGTGLQEIEARAVGEAELLAAAGFDAVMLQNTGDGPGRKDADVVEIAQMAAIGRVVRQAADIPVGVNVLKNGVESAFAIASAVRAEFVRIKVYVGAVVGSEGIVEGAAYRALTVRRKLGLDHVAILADVGDRTSRQLADVPLPELADWALRHGSADALVVTGRNATETREMLNELRRADIAAPLIVGGGVDRSTVAELLTMADGAIVGTALKSFAGFDQPISAERAHEFVVSARAVPIAYASENS